MAEVGAMSIDTEKNGKLHVQTAVKTKLASKENSVAHNIPGIINEKEREAMELGE